MDTVDYVIVGAGTAGCVVASRLSEDPNVSVLVLEAGGSDRTVWIQLPIGYGRTFFDPRINWMYDTASIPGLSGRSSYWPRGKVIGGSGSINAMVYVRGQPGDFDDWAALGNPGWSFNDVLPYFRMSEDYDGGETPHRGRGGPIHVTDITRHAHPLCRTFVETAAQIGARGVGQPVIGEVTALQYRLDQCQAGGGSVAHRHRHGLDDHCSQSER